MEIIIHVESRKMDKDLQLAVDEYVKRTSPYCKVTLKLFKNPDKLTFKNSSKIYSVVPGHNSPTSEGLAKLIEANNLHGVSCIEFLIQDTVSSNSVNTTLNQLTEPFNLSTFSMSPELTTVVLTEQIYRAYTIMNNITYHK